MTTDEERLAAIRAANERGAWYIRTPESARDDIAWLLSLVDRLKAERLEALADSEASAQSAIDAVAEVDRLRARVARWESGLHAFVFDVYASGETFPPKSLASFMKHIVPLDADTPSNDGGDRGA